MARIALMVGLLLVPGFVTPGGQGEVIDRVLAVVAGEIITQSDVDAAIALGLVALPAGADPRGAALDQLIERELTLREVRRYLPPEPPDLAVDARLDAVRSRFASPDTFARVLAAVGSDERRLRERVRDDLRIRAYLDERFGSVAQPTGEEIAAYYFAHPQEFTEAGRLRPLDEAMAEVRARLEAGRRAAVIGDWLAGLRRRAEVLELYRP
jgi:parvulin-like peptidyl-prolyl isomerase